MSGIPKERTHELAVHIPTPPASDWPSEPLKKSGALATHAQDSSSHNTPSQCEIEIECCRRSAPAAIRVAVEFDELRSPSRLTQSSFFHVFVQRSIDYFPRSIWTECGRMERDGPRRDIGRHSRRPFLFERHIRHSREDQTRRNHKHSSPLISPPFHFRCPTQHQ